MVANPGSCCTYEQHYDKAKLPNPMGTCHCIPTAQCDECCGTSCCVIGEACCGSACHNASTGVCCGNEWCQNSTSQYCDLSSMRCETYSPPPPHSPPFPPSAPPPPSFPPPPPFLNTLEGRVLVYGGAGAAAFLLCCALACLLHSKRRARLRREAVHIPHRFVPDQREGTTTAQPLLLGELLQGQSASQDAMHPNGATIRQMGTPACHAHLPAATQAGSEPPMGEPPLGTAVPQVGVPVAFVGEQKQLGQQEI
eukprot:CAMPEP_0181204404 /NCGR_PEP_ID=MMETSP1096-20121128/19919_1 /TAXON_ID=156174 ORGANISM="Chrysochromulina ericina, Strain CCMP281" /NCGR_SAMPLE_ID=MMETSP1096 /ASSEMBLY_ACC=CAM_ASM_000453 /LENGTH=252 /DNA_ID=CAMNT_0023295105 /DNA_START=26 /DNA_END=785 /DNA_ORIENTATION=-